MLKVNVIGAGLAGSEACYQLLKRGVGVNLYEMKPSLFSPAHINPNFAELVCSNSLKSDDVFTASGLLKQELRLLDSLLIKVADSVKVPAGSALAVDRAKFSEKVTCELKKFKNLTVINKEVTKIDLNVPTIIATGPLTSEGLNFEIAKLVGVNHLYFFDAIAPIVSANGIDFNNAYYGDRYGKGDNDYINCPLTKEEYEVFYNELIAGKTTLLKDFENKKVFEGCMPIEVLAKRGVNALRFGPLKPVGLINPKTNGRDYAVVQLRKENKLASMFNLVGFQTNLTFGEQKRIFSLIPALKNVEFLRYGQMHKNTFVNAPNVLNRYFQLKSNKNLFFAGQISGVEGYVESIASGLMCGINMYNYLKNIDFMQFSTNTIMGALADYISSSSAKNFQPMGANFGLIINFDNKYKNKEEKVKFLTERSLANINELLKTFTNI